MVLSFQNYEYFKIIIISKLYFRLTLGSNYAVFIFLFIPYIIGFAYVANTADTRAGENDYILYFTF